MTSDQATLSGLAKYLAKMIYFERDLDPAFLEGSPDPSRKYESHEEAAGFRYPRHSRRTRA